MLMVQVSSARPFLPSPGSMFIRTSCGLVRFCRVRRAFTYCRLSEREPSNCLIEASAPLEDKRVRMAVPCDSHVARFPLSFLKFLEENGVDPEVYGRAGKLPRYIRLKSASCLESISNLESELGVNVAPCDWLPGFYILSPNVSVAGTTMYRKGMIFGMDAASGAAVAALEINSSDHVLDLCAAPGTKLCMMADILEREGASGTLTAVDISQPRLAASCTVLKKYKLGDRCRLYLGDGTRFNVPPPPPPHAPHVTTCTPPRNDDVHATISTLNSNSSSLEDMGIRTRFNESQIGLTLDKNGASKFDRFGVEFQPSTVGNETRFNVYTGNLSFQEVESGGEGEKSAREWKEDNRETKVEQGGLEGQANVYAHELHGNKTKKEHGNVNVNGNRTENGDRNGIADRNGFYVRSDWVSDCVEGSASCATDFTHAMLEEFLECKLEGDTNSEMEAEGSERASLADCGARSARDTEDTGARRKKTRKERRRSKKAKMFQGEGEDSGGSELFFVGRAAWRWWGRKLSNNTDFLYDKVLVDAECTHDGSLKHIAKFDRWGWDSFERRFFDPKRIAALRDLQRGLISNGFRLLRENGKLVYSTCSFTEAQNEDIVSWFLHTHPNAELVDIPEAKKWPCRPGKLEGTLRFNPIVSNTNALFIACLRKIKL